MTDYRDIVFGGWDVHGDDLGSAAETHGVIPKSLVSDGASALRGMRPWKAVASDRFCRNVDGSHKFIAKGHRDAVERIADDLQRFKAESGVDRVVVLNLASTERWPDLSAEALGSLDAFERGLDRDDEAIGPAMLYAYAALANGYPYGNFTPSVAADVPRSGTCRWPGRTARPARP